jgi:hypothetical protein
MRVVMPPCIFHIRWKDDANPQWMLKVYNFRSNILVLNIVIIIQGIIPVAQAMQLVGTFGVVAQHATGLLQCNQVADLSRKISGK